MRYLVAAILLLVMLVCCGTVVACPALRERIIYLFQKEDAQHGNTHYTAVVEGAECQIFDIPTYYTLSAVPEGFIPVVSREGPHTVARMWLKSDSEPGAETLISFDQISLNTLCILSTEGYSMETVTFRNNEATLYTKPDAQTLVWYTEECMFMVGFWGPDTEGLDVFALADAIVQSKTQPLFLS